MGRLPVGRPSAARFSSSGPQVFPSIPALSQKLHHVLFFIQLTDKRQAFRALSFVQVLHEFEDVSFAEFSTRDQIKRTSQNCQLFYGQTVVSFLALHSSPRLYHTVLILRLFGRKRIHNRRPPRMNAASPISLSTNNYFAMSTSM
jgi:hypothetical protein